MPPAADGLAQPSTRLAFTAYRVTDAPFEILPAPLARSWMDSIPGRYAYRCLPLNIANQAGWFITVGLAVRATWDGGRGEESLAVSVEEEGRYPVAGSHFGSGILTWHIPFLFRTAPGYNLLVRGPSNWPLDGASPLEGIVEADWAVATFTMNWQLTRPGQPVTFPQGFPVAMLVPQPRYDLERFDPVARPVEHDPELVAAYRAWSDSRQQFNQDLADPSTAAARTLWQKHYFLGTAPSGLRAQEHQVKLDLRPFAASR